MIQQLDNSLIEKIIERMVDDLAALQACAADLGEHLFVHVLKYL